MGKNALLYITYLQTISLQSHTTCTFEWPDCNRHPSLMTSTCINCCLFSHTHILTVLDNPATFGIVITPDECTTPTVYLGSTVTLTCQAPSGFPTPSVAWFHNRVKIRQGDSPNLDFSSMKRISRINNIQHSNAGDYHCEVTNLIGRRNSTLTVLRVTTPACKCYVCFRQRERGLEVRGGSCIISILGSPGSWLANLILFW